MELTDYGILIAQSNKSVDPEGWNRISLDKIEAS